MKFVVYSNNEEVIVSTLETEHKVISDYFTNGDRVLDEYDRDVKEDSAISIRNHLKVD
ncbi:MAG TPA: hypothetical protein VNX68_10735 [Nitrosopumilaceae archaeon]|jgi:hypothetical protein|nr:hypothetical protein [Nitrosopumilaceae archaeon]